MRATGGFTLVELVLVLVLVGALSVFALPAFFDRSAYSEYAFQQELVGAFRYARKSAIASGCEVRVRVDAGGYALHYRGGGSDISCGTGPFVEDVPDPGGGGAYAASPPPGVAIGSGLTVAFDGLGRPSSAGTVNLASRSLTVEAGTGYVHD